MYYSQVGNYSTTGALAVRAQQTTVQTGLVARYSFDTSTGIDDSGNGHTGSVLNGTTFGVGKVGTAAVFDGINDQIEIPNHTDFAFGTGNFSIGVRFKPE